MSVYNLRSRMKACAILMTSIGMMIMMTVNVSGGPGFKLKAPHDYYEDPKTLSLLNTAMAGNLDKAKQLVSEGANPNAEGPRNNPYNRLRLLHYAIAANNAKAVTVLMGVGADPEMDTLGGAGPAILFAMTQDRMEMLSLLLDLRPITRLSHETIEDLLFESVTFSRRRCIELLIQRGVPIDLRDESGYTILMRAMDAQEYDLAEYLLAQGASIHVEAKGGLTPAYSVQYHLQKFNPGTATYNKVLHLKELMQSRGAHFPALSPAEVRAKRAKP